jgi:hypothetical protein
MGRGLLLDPRVVLVALGKPLRTVRMVPSLDAYVAGVCSPTLTFVTLALAGFGGGSSVAPAAGVRIVKLELHGDQFAPVLVIYTMDSG